MGARGQGRLTESNGSSNDDKMKTKIEVIAPCPDARPLRLPQLLLQQYCTTRSSATVAQD